MTTIRILLIIAAPATLEKFRNLLQQQKEEMEIAGEASTASAGLDLSEKLKPAVILVDLALLQETGFELVRQLRNAAQGKVLVLRPRASLQDALFLRKLIASGAAGVIETEETSENILRTIRQTASSKDMLSNLFVNLPLRYQTGTFGRDWQKTVNTLGLTSREADVLRLVLSGQSDQRISVSLGISENTVKKYKYAIYTKLMVNSGFDTPNSR